MEKVMAEDFLPPFPPDVLSENCASRQVLQHMTTRWAVLVMIALGTGRLRFSQLKRRIGGISERMLAQTLQVLEADGLVLREAYDVVPPHVEYELTALGRGASDRMCELALWIEGNLGALVAARKDRG
jgi:DNA-binding HxlR family transcriptional regulator